MVDDFGVGKGLICLHGLGGGSYFFSGLSQSLRNSHRVLSFDMPGTGFNVGAVDHFSLDSCVEAAIELIDQVAPESSVLLGHSMGAIVALKAYAERKEVVEGLVFLGGLPEPVPAIKEKLSKRVEKLKSVGMNGIGEEVMPGIFAEESFSRRSHLVGMYQRLLEMNSKKSYVESMTALVEGDANKAVEEVSVPCLAITGMEDLYASPFDVKDFVSSIPSETTFEVFENCGHMIFFEEPERLHESVSTFLQLIDSDWAFTYGDDT